LIVTTLLSNEQLIPAVVGAMFKFPDRASLQGAAIDVLSNIALDNFLRQDVCQRGGTSRIVSALDNPKLKQDPTIVCKAFAALSNLISGASVEVLQAQDLPAPKIFVQAMAAHPQNLPIQVGGAYALCKSCGNLLLSFLFSGLTNHLNPSSFLTINTNQGHCLPGMIHLKKTLSIMVV
jgi:hypothetical protein